VPDAAEVVELERRVFCSATGRAATQMASVMAEAAAADEASKLAWAVGRRIRKLLLVVGDDISGG